MRGISERTVSKSSLKLGFKKKKKEDLVCFYGIATEITLHHSRVCASTSYAVRVDGRH